MSLFQADLEQREQSESGAILAGDTQTEEGQVPAWDWDKDRRLRPCSL